MLPDIRISLPVIFVLWCLAAIWLNGVVMLAYPAMWLVVGLAFWAADRAFRASRPATAATSGTTEESR